MASKSPVLNPAAKPSIFDPASGGPGLPSGGIPSAISWAAISGGLLLVWCGWTSRNPITAITDALTNKPISERQKGRSATTSTSSSTATNAVAAAGGGSGVGMAAQAAFDAGFRGNGLVIAIAIALAESGGSASAVNTEGNEPPSRDRGAWQINDHWHPEVSDECAFNMTCSAKAVYRISAGGLTWNQWVTYSSGAYRQYLPEAQQAAAAVAA